MRGDLTPPAQVTSTYMVTNPGNTTLSGVTVSDDTCGPVDPVPATGTNVGDTDADGRLDPGEAWRFTCTHPVQQSLTTAPINVVNHATVTGTDPRGVVVNAAATDDYDVVTPAHPRGQDGRRHRASAGRPDHGQLGHRRHLPLRGDEPRERAAAGRDPGRRHPAVHTPTFTGGDTDGDGELDLTETWTYTCTATATADVVNTATVTGLPTQVTPTGPAGDRHRPRPPSTSCHPDLALTKSVDEHLVLPGHDGHLHLRRRRTPARPDLRNPADPVGSPTIPPVHWVTDDKCADVTYVSGDTDGDGLLNPGEAWHFTCQTAITTHTVNIATHHARSPWRRSR